MNLAGRSAIAGALATGPMTMVMSYLHRKLPYQEQRPLPPREITMKLARKTGVAQKLGSKGRLFLTLAAHFGYGSLAASLFSPLCARYNVPRLFGGITFGLGVWAVSYLGFLPLTGLHRTAVLMTPKRNLLMILAHIVWGASLGLAAMQLEERDKRLSGLRGP